jgi:phospholipid transport system substrate-binding protein
MKIKKWAVACCAFYLLVRVAGASTDMLSPLGSLQGPINQIIEVLNDPAYTESGTKKTQRKKIWEIARPIFDFPEISRRAIGKPWTRFTPSEKDRFTDVFAEFLGNTYIDKLQGEYHNETIDFQKELVKDTKALVRTKLRRQGAEIPIDYRMRKIGGAWKVYDIIVENGVSLIKNYRVQFSSILQKETPEQLIQRLEKKLSEKAY